MSHGASGGVHDLFSCLRIDHHHPDDSPQEPLMRIGWLLSPQSLQFFVVEKGFHPKIVVHSKSLELLGQRKVCEDHIMDLSCNKLVFIKRRPNLLQYLLSRRVVSSRPLGSWPGNSVQPTGRLESAAVGHRHVG